MPFEIGSYEWALAYQAEQDRLWSGECVENRGGEGDSVVNDTEMEQFNENRDSEEVKKYFFFICFSNFRT